MVDPGESRARQWAELGRALFTSSEVPSNLTGTDGIIREVNPAFEQITGRTAGDLIGSPVAELIGEQRNVDEGRLLDRLIRGEVSAVRRSGQLRTAAGTSRAVDVITQRLDLPDRREVVFFSELFEASSEGVVAEATNLARTATEGIVVTDEVGVITFVTPSIEVLLGYGQTELVGRSVAELVPASERKGLRQRMLSAASDHHRGSPASVEGRVLRRDGTEIHVELSLTQWDSGDGARQFAGVIRDISERNRLLADLHRAATQDPLTLLDNENALRAHLETAQSGATLVLIEVTDFRRIKHSLGHEVADAVLVALAGRFRSRFVVDGIAIARVSEARFALLVPSGSDRDTVVANLLDVVSTPLNVKGRNVRLDACMATARLDTTSLRDDILRDADTALSDAIRAGSGAVSNFTPAMRKAAEARYDLEDSLRRAIPAGEFVCFYQPQICLRTGETIAGEALLRWQHPEHGTLAPGHFIPVAEATGLIRPLGTIALEHTIALLADMIRSDRLPSDFELAVNLAAAQIDDPGFPAQVGNLLQIYDVPARHLAVELTETTTMNDPVRASRVLSELAERGHTISLDDFGTGYSSLARLRSLPLDQLKIDGSFLANATEPDGHQMLHMILDLAAHLQLQTVAEGIETAEQAEIAAALGCDVGQGYLYSPPIPATELVAFLAAGQAATV